MSNQEYARKYMIKDIIRYNLRFIWLIILCAVLVGAGLGYKKNKDYEKRFAQMELRGTVNQYVITYYTGNINGDSLLIRSNNLINIMQSKTAYDEFVRISGYDITYDAFVEGIICDNDGTKDVVSAKLQYPWGCDSFSIINDEQAQEYIGYYTQAVQNICDNIIGKDIVRLLGVSDMSTYKYEAGSEQRDKALKDVIKNIFIGFVIGAIIPVVVLTMIYLLRGRLNTAQEIAYYADAKLLASVKAGHMEELANAQLYLEYQSGGKPVCINLMHINDTGRELADAFAQYFVKQGCDVQVHDMGDAIPEAAGSDMNKINIYNTKIEKGNTECYRTAMKLQGMQDIYSADILVAGAGKVTEGLLERIAHEMSLYDINAVGVIVYESGK